MTTELNDILPPDLKIFLDSSDYEGEGGLITNSIKYLNNELHFDFSLFIAPSEQNEMQHWQLKVINYRNFNIHNDNIGSYFRFYSDHFLLWEYIDEETELYFKKRAQKPEHLFADIYTLHNSIFDNYIPVEKYINGRSSDNAFQVCNSDSGLFARGPKKILKYYFDCLVKAGSEPYYFGDHIAKRWDGEKWIPEEKDLKLALLGETYFIGQDFKFKRFDKKTACRLLINFGSKSDQFKIQA